MNDFATWLVEIFRQYNVLVLALLIVLQSNGIPLGSSFLVIASGAFAYINGGNILTLGMEVCFFAILGDTISYWLWRKVGPGIIVKYPLIGNWVQQGITRMEGYFARFGRVTVLFTRFPLSALGPLVNISAGVSRYRYIVFASWALVGESLWTAFNLGIGYWFGDSFEQVVPLVTQFSELIIILAAIAASGYWIRSIYRQKL